MAEVRRRRRNSSANASIENGGGDESRAPESNSESSRSALTRPIKETIDNEKSTAMMITIGGMLLGIFFIYLGITTNIPLADVSHAIVIDAGSTGTRAQVFSFRDGKLFRTKLVNSTNSIAQLAFSVPATGFFKPLLDGVKTVIPGAKRRKSIPLALRATAGLRLALPDVADRALDEARKALKSSGFLVKDEWVSILEDQSEGVGSWTTVNYLRGHLNGSLPSSACVVELGGSSLQIVFEANDQALEEVEALKRAAGKSRASHPLIPRVVLGNWGGKERKLIAINRLGFGMKNFANKMYLVFDREGVLTEGNPCFRKGKYFKDKSFSSGSEWRRVASFTGDGDFERCVASAQIALSQYGNLDTSVLAKFSGEIIGFAFMYERTVGLGISESPTKDELIEMGKKLCEGNGEIADDADDICLEFSYVYLLLSEITGEFRNDVQLRLIQYIDGHMLGWSLGSVLTDFQKELADQLA